MSLSILGAEPASAALLLEPMARIGMSNSSQQTSNQIGFGAGARIGIEKDETFTALQLDFSLANLATGNSGYLLTASVLIGGNLTYLPLRLWAGLGGASYTGSVYSLTGYTLRAGIGYFLSETLLLNLEPSRLNFTGSSGVAGKTAGVTNVELTVSMPFSLEPSEVPWRTRYRQSKLVEGN